MAQNVKNEYGNESISTLKGADRVRKRPAVIFGSDGIEGCQHSAFEIISNSIDEAREGYGKEITVTLFSDHSIQVEDHGRGLPVDYNTKEKKYNWEIVFCELYGGSKYNKLPCFQPRTVLFQSACVLVVHEVEPPHIVL